ncbi:MAG TPA: TonB-dependent receptor [Saprospirales bacterium]|nr:TonB-dependent receptor [Saprospirales bacterium]
MRKLTFALLYLAMALQASGQMQGIRRVRVLDALTREPVVAATVVLEGLPGGYVTDTLGRFQLPEKLLGQPETVRIQSIGYNSWTGALNDPSKEQVIWLEPSETALNTVVVTATMKEVSKDASPIPVEVYTSRFFQKNATANLFEALTIINGVRPQVNCNVCGTGDIQINGMPGPYTMITIDGMPIVSGLATVYGLSGIPNGMVERIEVVKGPAGTLYGSESVGGMINVITKNTLTAPRLYVDMFGTSIGESNLETALAAKVGRANTLLGVNYFRYQNPLDINGDNFTDMVLQNRVSVFNKWNFDRRNHYLASVAARYVHENRWGGEMDWEPRWRGTDSIYGESIYTNRMEVLGRYQLPLANRRVMMDASWNLHDQNSVYGNVPYLGRQQVAFGQLTTDLPLGKNHDALLGVALRHTYYDDNTPATAAPDGEANNPSRIWLPGIFLQDDWEINTRNCLVLGLRYDYNSVHGNILTPRLSWKWAKNAQHVLRFTAGSGYRIANIFTEDHAALTGARTVVITENLRPERSWNGNLNYTRKFFPKRAGYIGLDASLFYTYFSNQILPDFDTDPNQIIYDNLEGHAVSSGASVNLDINFVNGLKIIAGATAMNVYRVENGERLTQLYAPPFSGTWTVTYPITKWGLTLDYTGNLNSPMRLPILPNDYRPEYSPWFSIHNVQITKSFQRGIQVYLGVKNLFGFFPREDVIMRAFDPFDKQVDINNPNGYTFDPSYNYAPIQRQRALVGLRWTLK